MISTPITISPEERLLLRNAANERDTLKSKLRVVTVERDLLLEKLKKFQHKLFNAKSEARSTEQQDLFFNEAKRWHPRQSRTQRRRNPEILMCRAISARSLVASRLILHYRV